MEKEQWQMAEIAEKLNKLESSVCSDAKAIAEEIISSAKSKKKQLLQISEDKLLEEFFKYSQGEIKKIKADYLKKISHIRFETKQQKFAYRTKKIEELFNKIKIRLIDFTKTSEYTEYLDKLLKKAEGVKAFDNNTVVNVKPCDMDNPVLKTKFGKKLNADKSIELGGITIFYPDDNMFCDFSLDSALKKEKEEFINNFNLEL